MQKSNGSSGGVGRGDEITVPSAFTIEGMVDGCGGSHSNGECPVSDEMLTGRRQALSKTNKEILRLIGQYLDSLGFTRTVTLLMEESDCQLDHPSAAEFKRYVLKGDWAAADRALSTLAPLLENPESITAMRFLLFEQKCLELIDRDQRVEALKVLQNELTPLRHRVDRVHKLASCLMVPDHAALMKEANWCGKGSREQLMNLLRDHLPPSIMLPPDRLKTLLSQAVDRQIEMCLFHNNPALHGLGSCSLLHDHTCSREDFPTETIQLLSDHIDEVWYCAFSPNGKTLATGSKDSNVILWDVDPETLTVRKRKTLSRHTHGAAFMAWSPNSKWLLVCGQDDCSDIWLWDAEKGELKQKISHASEDSLTVASFHRCSTKFVCGGVKGQFSQCDLEGTILDSWDGVRVRGLWCKDDGKTVYASDTHHRIRGYVLDDMQQIDYNLIQEDHPIMSFSVSSDGKTAILNVSTQGVHVWNLETRTLLRKFTGVTQGYYTIYSCFGGLHESFVASGSEDKKVYIWHIKHDQPIAVLSGHLRTVNCVSWNPKHPGMLASASDDGTVRIWGPAKEFRATKALGESSTSMSGSASTGDVNVPLQIMSNGDADDVGVNRLSGSSGVDALR
ncbi:unnamed protein product [Cyprideis torosa]|uniref:CTLH domain-containing protein n=1 Tax=Cyprideis torosa TaxID=163714 RepID=A0A7R8WD59_9CRUS|nr:unnamed protein product [Cyprideis torosa]CAG0888613.1 unnamed protein product [Cyprideis torosa]